MASVDIAIVSFVSIGVMQRRPEARKGPTRTALPSTLSSLLSCSGKSGLLVSFIIMTICTSIHPHPCSDPIALAIALATPVSPWQDQIGSRARDESVRGGGMRWRCVRGSRAERGCGANRRREERRGEGGTRNEKRDETRQIYRVYKIASNMQRELA